MTSYCPQCGHFRPLSTVSAWCSECTEQWAGEYRDKKGAE